MSKKTEYSKSVRTDTGSKSMNVEEVENGFIIRITSDDKNDKGEYEYKSTTYISDKNPFEKDTKSFEDSVVDLLSDMTM